MANWTTLKAAVAKVIKTNGNQEITGQVLQNVLNNIISNLGANATFAGIATPATNPGVPDGNVFYLAAEAGIYVNFGGAELEAGLNILLWNGSSWSVTKVMTIVQELGDNEDKVISQKGVTQKITDLYQGFMQDSYSSDYKKANIWGWNSVSVEKNVQTSVFGGEVRNADKVTILTHSGPTWAFNTESQAGNEGKIININAIIYSPVAFDVRWNVFSGSGGTYEWISPYLYRFKAGVNYIWLAIKVTAANSSTWQIYFSKTQIIGQVLYSVQYFYYGTRRMTFFPDFVAYTNDKPCLIQDTFPSAYKKYVVENWDSSRIERNYETNVFGMTMEVIKITMPGSTGNPNDFQIRLMYVGNQIDGLKQGDRINVNFFIYVPEDCELSVSKYSNGIEGDIEIITGKYLRKGVNSVVLSGISTGEDANAAAICNLTLGADEVFYVTQPIAYIGYPVANTTLFNEIFVAKEEGKGLSEENFTSEDKKRLASVDISILYDNLCVSELRANNGVVSLGFDSGGNLVLEKKAGKGGTGWAFINWKIDNGTYWKQNHVYYFAISCLIESNSLTERSDSTGGNNVFSLSAKYVNSIAVGNGRCKEGVVTGTEGVMKFSLSITREDNTVEEYPKSNWIFVQFGSYQSDDYFKMTVYDIILIDLGENAGDSDWMSMDELVLSSMLGRNFLDNRSVIKNCMNAVNAQYAQTAEVANSLAVGKDIECWGDSLTAQNYAQYLSQILGRNCFNHGYGGKTSTYIRDQFLSGFNPDRTQIIWVGRNNYTRMDVVIDDIRDMVTAFGKQNFIIMMPPNGYYGDFGTEDDLFPYPEDGSGEMRGGTGYDKFMELTDRLSKEYPANFLDSREASIHGWRMGNVKLLQSFTQPEVGENVQISVSDANFLTAYNTYDEEKFGTDFMSHIRIGINVGHYSKYKIISKDSDTLLTVKLVDAAAQSPGTTIENIIDNGGTNSVMYLRVMQEADYMCWRYDTTLSTFRSDGIHMTENGKKLIAEIVARKIVAMGI